MQYADLKQAAIEQNTDVRPNFMPIEDKASGIREEDVVPSVMALKEFLAAAKLALMLTVGKQMAKPDIWWNSRLQQ
jgi:hypothetical protein